MDINVDLLQWFISFFDKKASGGTVKNEIVSNKELAFNKKKVHSLFVDNIWGVDLADMQLISKFNKGFRFLLCVIDIYRKYEWVIPLKDKKELQILILSKNLR